MLAALAKAPSGFSPRHDLKKAQERAALVLETMAQTRLIDAAVAERARENPATIVDRGSDPQQDYFFDAAAAEAKRFTLDVTGDFVVVTTLDPIMQAATHSVTAQMFKERGETATASQVAMVVMSTDGAVRALLGGRDYGESQFDRATQ